MIQSYISLLIFSIKRPLFALQALLLLDPRAYIPSVTAVTEVAQININFVENL